MFRAFFPILLLFSLSNLNATEPEAALKIVEETCQHCHGLHGESSDVIYPRLAGQHEEYIVRQLHDFRSGEREGTMNDIAVSLTDADINALAVYFSSQPVLSHTVRNKEFAAVGWYIFHRGNKYSGIPPCASCHGKNGEGTERIPRLAGQHKHYVSDQLTEFSERDPKRSDPIMHSIAIKLTEMEIEAVANYVSGLK
jgi:cytochrome c553